MFSNDLDFVTIGGLISQPLRIRAELWRQAAALRSS